MVAYDAIRASNALINDDNIPHVAIFAGGTSGIGKYTVKALVKTGASIRIYLIGRESSAEPMQQFIQELKGINSKAEVIWTEGEISLLAETKRICDLVKSKEKSIDLLFLSAGYAPMGTRKETSEGLELSQSLEYYSRKLFILQLLPQLKAAEAPRVVSILSGGMEREGLVDLDDLDLKKPGNFSGVKAQVQYGIMITCTMDKLAIDNPEVTFIHSWPGLVDTGNGESTDLWH
jgi:NAD(P)-dependent dehydrogenase (short-subunit alcohol dehydrogenase family)